MERCGTQPVSARVVGFSTGRSNNRNGYLHSIAQYQGIDGRTYYLEAAVGSSAPLHAASIFVFWITFRFSLFSLAGAAIVLGGTGLKAGKARRKPPLSMKEWREYKSEIFSPRVFTDQSRDQIPWADSGRLEASIASQMTRLRLMHLSWSSKMSKAARIRSWTL